MALYLIRKVIKPLHKLNHMNKRREFLKTAATGIALTAISGKILGAGSKDLFGTSEQKRKFGLQLYTLRDDMPKDPRGILKKVAAMGYKYIESFEHDKLGMFWGMSNVEFKRYLDELGLNLVSSHCNINKDFDRKAEEAAAIGMKYLICPSIDNEKGMSVDDCKKAADLFNTKGEVCKKNGIRFAYHNHDGPFISRGNHLIPEEYLIKNTNPELVDFEMDIYWVVTAGQDPLVWLKKYPNRFKLGHLKDRKKNTPLSEREVSVNLGTGSIDFHKICHIAKEHGMTYFIVEQEKYEGSSPLAAAKADADYLKKLKF